MILFPKELFKWILKNTPMNRLKFLFLLIPFFVSGLKESEAQISRGADTAEIYINTQWYKSVYEYPTFAIFRSVDNGMNLHIQSSYCNDYYGLVADLIPGSVHLLPIIEDTIKFSDNYGQSFIGYHTSLDIEAWASGCIGGELYIKAGPTVINRLYRSTDNGQTFELMNGDFLSDFLQDVGTEPGEVYAIENANSQYPVVTLKYSNDYGQTYTTTVIDTSLLLPNSGMTWITRGAQAGEFYMIRLDSNYNYHIYHTFDNGKTIEQKYITASFDWYMDGALTFTGGRVPGTFYMMRVTDDTNGVVIGHTLMWIYFSRDYGASYVKYFYDLDSTFTSAPGMEAETNEFVIYPNPADDRINVRFRRNNEGAEIEVFDIFGTRCYRKSLQPWTDKFTILAESWKPGVYIVKVRSGGSVVGVKRMVKM